MAKFDSQETQRLAVTTADKYATFEGGINHAYVVADADCFIDFDRPALLNSSLLLKANTQPVELNFKDGQIQTLHAVCASTANLYILGVRG